MMKFFRRFVTIDAVVREIVQTCMDKRYLQPVCMLVMLSALKTFTAGVLYCIELCVKRCSTATQKQMSQLSMRKFSTSIHDLTL